MVPCAEARQEEAEENVPQTDLFTERESEENTAEVWPRVVFSFHVIQSLVFCYIVFLVSIFKKLDSLAAFKK